MGLITKKISRIKWDLQKIERSKRRAADRGIRKSLALIRMRARQNEIRKAYGKKRGGPGKTSRPGQRPFAHAPEGIRTIAYEYNYRKQSGIVGPVIRAGSGVGVKNQVTAPNAIEYGSRMTMRQSLARRRDGSERWVRVTRKNIGKARKRKSRSRTITVQKRPFMVPAMEHLASAGKISAAFKGTWK